jgi:hypothetical protein
MSDATTNDTTGVYMEQGGQTLTVGTSGVLDVVSGGKIKAAGTQASNIADASALTENSGVIGGTNDGDLPDIDTVSGSPSQAEVTAIRDAVREVAASHNTLVTKVNAVIAVLEGIGAAASS